MTYNVCSGTLNPTHSLTRFLDPDILTENDISALSRRVPLIFAFDVQKIRHLSTSGLVNLLIPKECYVFRSSL